jgi:hypothetical protein
MILDITFEIIKTESPSSKRLVQNLIERNLLEKSIDEISDFKKGIEQEAFTQDYLGLIVDLEVLTQLAEFYLNEFKASSCRCLNLVLDTLEKLVYVLICTSC